MTDNVDISKAKLDEMTEKFINATVEYNKLKYTIRTLENRLNEVRSRLESSKLHCDRLYLRLEEAASSHAFDLVQTVVVFSDDEHRATEGKE